MEIYHREMSNSLVDWYSPFPLCFHQPAGIGAWHQCLRSMLEKGSTLPISCSPQRLIPSAGNGPRSCGEWECSDFHVFPCLIRCSSGCTSFKIPRPGRDGRGDPEYQGIFAGSFIRSACSSGATYVSLRRLSRLQSICHRRPLPHVKNEDYHNVPAPLHSVLQSDSILPLI